MTVRQCMRCGLFWTFNCGDEGFAVITRFCPSCVAAILPRMGDDSRMNDAINGVRR